jgi:phospholipase A1
MTALCCLLAGISKTWAAGAENPLQDCARIDAEPQRLACYDALAGRTAAAPDAPGSAAPDAPNTPGAPETRSAANTPDASTPSPPPTRPATAPELLPLSSIDDEFGSMRLDRYWELRKDSQRGAFVLMPFRSNYMMPASYNFSPNQDAFPDSLPEVNNLEVKFQLSVKFKIWEDVAQTPVDVWFGYTQQSYWQLWGQHSSPFRETDYEPAVFAGLPVSVNVLGLRTRLLTAGFVHQSNGNGDPLSRSWNRLVGSAIFERGHLVGQVRAWYRIPEPSADDNNPDITRYLGHGDVSLSWVHGRNEWSATLKNPTRPDRGGVELGWSFPLFKQTPVRGYVQYYYGYGENLLDYNHVNNRLSLGFLVSDWF